ncbi:TIM44-like domain-containing protein [Acidisphaera sp. L21]|uniref:Tim44 domain-containing protein n=1 Tax=Acidisphaera sp. L21 TaxID=1641851 RepID=UPI00131C9A12|nr:TIM44-like domain-containing protein [Acidisphaera sp. L21]
MNRLRLPLAAVLALAIALAPGLALARVGGGASMGSRGGNTYSAPPSTGTAPYSAAPMQRSYTPRSEPSIGAPSPGYSPGYGGGFGGMRGGFASGLLGGLVGAGIGGMLFGHGMFGGIDGGGSIIGLLIQFALIFFIGRWLLRMFFNRQPMFAGFGGGTSGGTGAGMGPRPGMFGGGGSARPAPPPIAISPADYQTFEQLLKGMQAAWSAEDLNALRSVATPEMASYFGEQLAELRSRGLRNTVTDVHLDKGDLAEAWSEGSREYATVAMKFSMIDVTRDGRGQIVDGSPNERQLVTEVWTFVRSPGGRWILSAIQQAK